MIFYYFKILTNQISRKSVPKTVSTSYIRYQSFLLGHPNWHYPLHWNGGRLKQSMDKEHDSRYVRVRRKRIARPKLQETAEGLFYGLDLLVVSIRKSLHCFLILRPVLEKFSPHNFLPAHISYKLLTFLPDTTARYRR